MSQNWGNVTRKKKQSISKPVHYVFVIKHKMSQQDKTFIFTKNIHEFALILVAYIHANKDLFIRK